MIRNRMVQKGQISLNFNNKVNFNDFYTNFVCVPTNKRHKTYQTGFLLRCLGHAPGVGVGGTGMPRGQKKKFSNMVMSRVVNLGTTMKLC